MKQSWFFEWVNEMSKPIAKSSKNDDNIQKWGEKVEIIPNTITTQFIIKSYREELHSNT